jgi:hypothetical protein
MLAAAVTQIRHPNAAKTAGPAARMGAEASSTGSVHTPTQ